MHYVGACRILEHALCWSWQYALIACRSSTGKQQSTAHARPRKGSKVGDTEDGGGKT